jgi:hypothetical protein
VPHNTVLLRSSALFLSNEATRWGREFIGTHSTDGVFEASKQVNSTSTHDGKRSNERPLAGGARLVLWPVGLAARRRRFSHDTAKVDSLGHALNAILHHACAVARRTPRPPRVQRCHRGRSHHRSIRHVIDSQASLGDRGNGTCSSLERITGWMPPGYIPRVGTKTSRESHNARSERLYYTDILHSLMSSLYTHFTIT